MTGLRPPLVAGVAGGVGTTTLAVALCGHEAGRAGAAAADILVCRDTLDSLRRAAAVLEVAGPAPRPVLAVTTDGPRPPYGSLRARLEMLEPAASAVVLLPYVRAWRTVADPLPEAAQLLVAPPQRVARPVRAYATAVRELASAVVRSGRLQTPPARLTGPDAPSPSEPPGTRRFGEGPRPARAPGGDRPAQAPRVVGAFRPVVASAPRHAVPQRGVRIVAPARAAADLAADAADPARRVDQAG